MKVIKRGKKINMARTKRTTRKTTGGWPFGNVKKDPQEEIRQVSFVEDVWIKAKDKNAFRRRDNVMIKSHEFFYPPSLVNKACYGPFEINRICKNNRVEIKDHTRWMAKIPNEEVMNLRDYMAGLNSWREKQLFKGPNKTLRHICQARDAKDALNRWQLISSS